MSRALILFARAPELGRVKTRLAAGAGAERALAIYRWLGAHVVARTAGVEACRVTVAFTPPDHEALMRAWLGPSVALHPQCDGDLGQRMAAAITHALREGAEHVAVIGTDCPDVSASIVDDAFARLADADVVLGPAADGGYYLIAVSRALPALFTGIPWSSPDTLRATVDAARALGLRVALLDRLPDIDTAEDWAAWRAGPGAHDAMEDGAEAR